MNNEKITPTQFFVLLFCIKASFFVLVPYELSMGMRLSDGLGALLLCILFSFVMMYIIIICRRYNVHDLIYKSKLLSGLFILYMVFSVLGSMLIISDFITELSGSMINKQIIIFSVLAGAVYAAFLGIEAVARFSGFALAALLISCAAAVYFLLPSFSSEQLSPFYTGALKTELGRSMILFSWTGDLSVLFLLSGNIKGDIRRPGLIFNSLLSVFLVFMLLLFSGASGTYLMNMPFPVWHAADASGELQRSAPLLTGVVISLVFCLLSTQLYVIKNLISVFGREYVRPAFFVIAGLILAATALIQGIGLYPDSYVRAGVILLFSAVIPLLLLMRNAIMSFVRRRKRQLTAASLTLCILLSAITLSGCTSLQLNQRLIVQGIGIDRAEDNSYSLTLLLLDTDTHERENVTKTVYCSGESTEDALLSLEERTGRRLLMSQCLFLMMGENAAKELDQSVSYFCDIKDMMKTTSVMICRGEAGDCIRAAVEKMGLHPENINTLSGSDAIHQDSEHVTIFDYMTWKKDESIGMRIPLVERDEKDQALIVSGSLEY